MFRWLKRSNSARDFGAHPLEDWYFNFHFQAFDVVFTSKHDFGFGQL